MWLRLLSLVFGVTVYAASTVLAGFMAGLGTGSLIAGRLANTPDNLVQWLRRPQIIKPGTAMPDMGVTEVHARDMAAYLATLD